MHQCAFCTLIEFARPSSFSIVVFSLEVRVLRGRLLNITEARPADPCVSIQRDRSAVS